VDQEVIPRKLTAERVLEKFQVDETILAGIGCDLDSVLRAWRHRNRKTKKKKTKMVNPNPNTSIAFKVRNVIGSFKLAMEQLKTYESGKNERDINRHSIRKNKKKISELGKYVNQLEETVLQIKSENKHMREESKRISDADEMLGTLKRQISNCDKNQIILCFDDFRGDFPHEDDQDDELVRVATYQKEQKDGEKDGQVILQELKLEKKSLSGWLTGLKMGKFDDSLDDNKAFSSASVIDCIESSEDDHSSSDLEEIVMKSENWLHEANERILRNNSRVQLGGIPNSNCGVQTSAIDNRKV